MAKRKSFLIRMPPDLLDAWRRVAEAELRSLNAQIEVELRAALRRRGIRLGEADPDASAPNASAPNASDPDAGDRDPSDAGSAGEPVPPIQATAPGPDGGAPTEREVGEGGSEGDDCVEGADGGSTP